MRKLLAVLLVLAPSVSAMDLSDRPIRLKRIEQKRLVRYDWGMPVYETRPVYVASLAPVTYFAPPLPLFQVQQEGGGGASLSANNTWTGSNIFAGVVAVLDSAFSILDNADNSKVLQFQASGITTGTTRTLTAQNGDYTIAGTNFANTFSSIQTMANDIRLNIGSGPVGRIGANTTQTPDNPVLYTEATSQAWQIFGTGQVGSDMGNGACGTSACVDPTLTIHSAVANQTDYCSWSSNGLSCKYVKTLTESAATSVFRVPVAAEEGTGGEFWYTIYATDGSTPQVRQGRVIFSVTNDGGTETCVLGTPEETDNTPTGTLTVTVTCDTTPTNAVDLQLNAVSSLSQTTLESRNTLILVGPGLVARQ